MAASADGGVLYRGLLLNFDSKDNTDSEAVSVGAAPCGCPKRVNSFCYFKIKQVKGISAWATTRGRPYEIIFMQPNNNLTVCSLLGHSDKSFVNSNLAFAKQKNSHNIFTRSHDGRRILCRTDIPLNAARSPA